jgi:hypothetical protein
MNRWFTGTDKGNPNAWKYTCPSDTWSTTDLTWTDLRSNPELRYVVSCCQYRQTLSCCLHCLAVANVKTLSWNLPHPAQPRSDSAHTSRFLSHKSIHCSFVGSSSVLQRTPVVNSTIFRKLRLAFIRTTVRE